MKMTKTFKPAITSSLSGTIVEFDPNGYPFTDNANAICLAWSPRWCKIRLL